MNYLGADQNEFECLNFLNDHMYTHGSLKPHVDPDSFTYLHVSGVGLSTWMNASTRAVRDNRIVNPDLYSMLILSL